MKKHHSILAACLTSGLVCGIAAATLADDITPTSGTGRQTAQFDSVAPSRIDAAGQLLRSTEATAAQARFPLSQADELNQIQPNRLFVRLAETALRDTGNDLVVRQGNTSARGLNVSWTIKVSRISALGDTKRRAGSFARSVNVKAEPAVGNTLRQGPFQPRAID